MVNGKEETRNTAQEGDFVVQANTKWKENYILSHARTSEAYEPLKAPEQSDRAGDGLIQSDGDPSWSA
eukprot:g4158.t1